MEAVETESSTGNNPVVKCYSSSDTLVLDSDHTAGLATTISDDLSAAGNTMALAALGDTAAATAADSVDIVCVVSTAGDDWAETTAAQTFTLELLDLDDVADKGFSPESSNFAIIANGRGVTGGELQVGVDEPLPSLYLRVLTAEGDANSNSKEPQITCATVRNVATADDETTTGDVTDLATDTFSVGDVVELSGVSMTASSTAGDAVRVVCYVSTAGDT